MKPPSADRSIISLGVSSQDLFFTMIVVMAVVTLGDKNRMAMAGRIRPPAVACMAGPLWTGEFEDLERAQKLRR